MKLRSVRCIAVAACSTLTALGQQYTWTALAGQPPQSGRADGPAAEARYFNPNSLVADSAGNVYVSDTFNHTIRKLAPDGTATTLAGAAGVLGTADGSGTGARFSSPNGIALDTAGNLFVADRGNHTIRKITPAGVVTTFAGLAGTPGSADGPAPVARLNSPSHLTADRDGDLWVCDFSNHTVRRITAAGVVTTAAGLATTPGSTDGTGSTARFNSPFGIVQDVNGDLIVADFGNHTLRRLTRDGVVTTLAGSARVSGPTSGPAATARFYFPAALTIDPEGNLYIADSANDCIRRLTPAGIVSVFAGSADVRGSANGTATTARFYAPYGITWAPSGELFVADTLNHTIRRVTSAQIVSNFSGPGGGFGNVDATGAAARFNYPQGLALDTDDSLLIADWRNSAIRHLTPDGVVTTRRSFTSPQGIAVGGGVIAVTDRTRHFVRLYPATGSNFADIGTSGQAGATDGPLAGVLFNQPYDICVDTFGRIVVADTGNHTIRLLGVTSATSGFVGITIAGQAGVSGATNGAGTAARFSSPRGVAVDRAGVLYVADSGSHTIRRAVGAATTVTTFAGLASTSGTASGAATVARFNTPEGITTDAAGNVYVADRGNHAIRRITADGFVTTIGGSVGSPGFGEGTGLAARFNEPVGIVVDSKGVVYVVSTANNVVMRGILDTRPIISVQPQATVLAIGGSAVLSVSATGGGLSYQWRYEGAAIAGATRSSYALTQAQAAQSGRYSVTVTNSADSVISATALLTIKANVEVSRIVNLAIRSQAGTGAETLIVGLGIGGAGTLGDKSILIRGIGPTLGAFGVAGVLTDPRLELYFGATKINENDNWLGNAEVTTIGSQVGAFALSNAASRDAALYLPSLKPGSYSVQITGGTGAGGTPTGVALAEVYDATPPGGRTATAPRLTNVSARTQVGVDGDVLIAGFVIAGETSKTVLIRAIGPTLGSFGVAGALADPKLELFGANGKITENDNWDGVPQLSSTFFAVGAFPLTASSRDAVLLVTLAPGNYTAQISGANSTTGVALVEVYEVP